MKRGHQLSATSSVNNHRQSILMKRCLWHLPVTWYEENPLLFPFSQRPMCFLRVAWNMQWLLKDVAESKQSNTMNMFQIIPSGNFEVWCIMYRGVSISNSFTFWRVGRQPLRLFFRFLWRSVSETCLILYGYYIIKIMIKHRVYN